MSLIHQIGLTLIRNVGHVHARRLLDFFGSAEAVFSAGRSDLLQVQGIGESIARQILQTDALVSAEEQLRFIEKHKIAVLFYTADNYPQRLKNCYDAPVLLYYKGTAELNHPRVVSIVGTRNATAYGRQICRQLIEALVSYDVLVISGLAYGIDVAAHKESLAFHLPTVGVLGHGLDRIYPPIHRQIANEMLKSGGLLTEFPFGTNPDKENFPKRNRIIAGLADVTVVIEAAMKGGALITADIANSYDRDVYAFPGKISDTYSRGCNFLIRTNRAGLITDPKELIYNMGWDHVKPVVSKRQFQLPLDISADESRILTLLKSSVLRIDEFGIKTEMQHSKLAVHLLNLELKGYIISLPGKIYQLNI